MLVEKPIETVVKELHALVENVEREQKVLAEAHGRHVERLDEIERRFEQRFEKVEREIMHLDVKLSSRIDALATRVDGIAAHLGLGAAIPPGPAG